MRLPQLFAVLLAATLSGTLPAQPGMRWQQTAWSLSAQRGQILPVEPFLRGQNLQDSPLRRFDAYALTVLLPARDASAEWRQRYGHPQTGFGIGKLHLHNRQELGNPVVLYRSFSAPFWQRGQFRWTYGADVGLAAGWQRYDPDDNPFNDLISTRLTAYFRLRTGVEWLVSRHLTTFLDAGLTHVSNGNVKRPNAGLNATAIGVGLRYRPHPEDPPRVSRLSPYPRVNSLSVSVFGAVEKQLYNVGELDAAEKYRGITHPIGGVTVAGYRRLSYKSRVGLGTSLLCHGGTGVSVWSEGGRLHHRHGGSMINGLRAGIYPAYELVFDRWSVQVQAEYYVLAPAELKSRDRFRQRLGLKYHLSERLFAAVLVNARQFSVADFVEWHVGYTFRQNRPRPVSD